MKRRAPRVFRKGKKRFFIINGKKHIISKTTFKNNKNLVHFVINNIIKSEKRRKSKPPQKFQQNTPEFKLSRDLEVYKRGIEKEKHEAAIQAQKEENTLLKQQAALAHPITVNNPPINFPAFPPINMPAINIPAFPAINIPPNPDIKIINQIPGKEMKQRVSKAEKLPEGLESKSEGTTKPDKKLTLSNANINEEVRKKVSNLFGIVNSRKKIYENWTNIYDKLSQTPEGKTFLNSVKAQIKPGYKLKDLQDVLSKAADKEEIAKQAIREEEEAFGKEGTGKDAKLPGKGLWDYQIDELMAPFQKYGYLSTICSDEIPKLIPEAKGKSHISFIINTLPRSSPPSEDGHWQACYIDTKRDKSVEFYDSFADEPSEQFLVDIKKLIDALQPETYLKFKVNMVIDQRANSSECGYFSMHFIIQRIEGHKFRDCTGYSDVTKSEKDIKKFEKTFGHI